MRLFLCCKSDLLAFSEKEGGDEGDEGRDGGDDGGADGVGGGGGDEGGDGEYADARGANGTRHADGPPEHAEERPAGGAEGALPAAGTTQKLTSGRMAPVVRM